MFGFFGFVPKIYTSIFNPDVIKGKEERFLLFPFGWSLFFRLDQVRKIKCEVRIPFNIKIRFYDLDLFKNECPSKGRETLKIYKEFFKRKKRAALLRYLPVPELKPLLLWLKGYRDSL